MHLAAGIWKDDKDMRVDKSIKIELETLDTVSYTHLRAHETLRYLVFRLLG